MKIHELSNLYTANFEDYDFTVCVCAESEEEAKSIAEGYGLDSKFDIINIDVRELDENDEFDCDYVLSANDIEKEYKDSRESLKPKYDFVKPLYVPDDVSLCCDETYGDDDLEM